jgi:D-alanyl-D-alanine carboxypeptidase
MTRMTRMTTRSMTRGVVVAGVVLGLALTGCTESRAGTPATTVTGAALDRSLAELVAMPGGPPGVIAMVQVGDHVTVHVAGVAKVGTSTPPAPDDYMRIASVSKAFSGATALALVDKGTLSLDDSIGKLLPTEPSAWAEVTLRQLLNHTSGLPDFTHSPGLQGAALKSLDVSPSPRQLLTYVADQPLNFPPGSQYLYSNSDNIAVGLMIESATGKPYEESLQKLVLDPLKLTSTSLPKGTDISKPTFRGYGLDEPHTPSDQTTVLAAGWAWASGGIVSTPADLNKFIRGYVGGRLFGARTRAMQTDLFIPGGESGPPGPGLNSASLSLYRYKTPCGVVYGHTGNTLGYTQFAAASPDGTRSATVSINLALNENSTGQAVEVLNALREAEAAAACMALDGL